MKANVYKKRILAFEKWEYGVLKYHGRLCVIMVDGLHERIMEEDHSSKNSIRSDSTKMYNDLIEIYWWNGMKKGFTEFVVKFLNYQQVNVEHQSWEA